MTVVGLTGASGFLGSYLRQRLPQLGAFDIRGLTRTLGAEPVSQAASFVWVQGDLQQPTDCAEFVHDLDVIVHLAHSNTPLTSNKNLPADAHANLVPTLNLIEAIRSAGTRPHVIFASSGGGVYAPPAEKRPLREDHPCIPSTSYGIQKIATELYLQLAAANGWLTATTLRISNAYGMLLPSARNQGLVGVAVNRALRGEPIRLFGNPENVRDYVHVDDVARAVALAMRTGEPYATYNIGSGTGLSVRDVVALIQKVLGRAIELDYLSREDAAHLAMWNVLDVTRAERHLGWQPRISFEQGLRSLIDCHVN